MQLILLGAPGSGKGTQAASIIKHFNLTHLSTGDMLRAEVAARTTLGKEAKAIMDAGQLVSDEIVLAMIEERLTDNQTDGFLFDGFPRTLAQAEGLETLLTRNDKPLDAVVYLDVPFEEITKRLLNRGRGDDNQETISKRLQVFESQTFPLITHYQKQGKLHTVNGTGELADIWARIKAAIS